MNSETDNNIKIFRSSVYLAAVRIGVILIAEYILAQLLFWALPLITPVYIPIYMRRTLIPVMAAVIAAVYTACRYTTVKVQVGAVEVRKNFKTQIYSLRDCVYSSESEKSSELNFFTPLYKYFLIVTHKDETQEKLRLWCFSADTCDELVNYIYTAKLDRRNKAAAEAKTYYELNFGQGELQIDRAGIIVKEWKNVCLISVIWIAICAVLVTFALTGKPGEYSGNFKMFAAIVMSLFCVALIPFSIIKTRRNTAACPSKLSFSGEHFMIDDDHFTASDIVNVSMTSVKLESNSIYPVQRYLTVKTDDKTYRYWLGSQYSVTSSEYMNIFRFVNDAFLPRPGIFTVSSRRGWLNR